MTGPKLAKLERQIMETMRSRGQVSIRKVQETFPDSGRLEKKRNPNDREISI